MYSFVATLNCVTAWLNSTFVKSDFNTPTLARRSLASLGHS
jgi:hypothetical protein